MTAGSFNVSMLLTADASRAKAELASTTAAVSKTKAEVAGLGQQSAATDAQIAGLQAELGRMRTQLDAVVLAEAKASSAAEALTAKVAQLEAALGRGGGRSGGRGAAAAISNLVAQFNDIGVMMASGQSPLLLAAQQGTQISQVLGPLGARGAVQALSGAFLGMLNPVNFAVFGAVAALGLLGGALRGVFGDAKSVEDAIGELADATKSWQQEAKIGNAELARMFGDVTPEIVELQRQITELSLVELLLKAADATDTLGSRFDNLFGKISQSQIADLLNVPLSRQVTGKDGFRSQQIDPAVQQFKGSLETLNQSTDLSDQIAALRSMRELILQSAGGIRGMSDEQREYFKLVRALEAQLLAAKAAQEGLGSAAQIAQAWGEKTLADLRSEAEIRNVIRAFGEDSVEVVRARFQAERQAFETLLASKDITGQLRDELIAAWDAANGTDTGLKGMLASFLDVVGASDDTRRAVEDAWDAITGATGATNVWASAMAGVAAKVQGIGQALASLGKTEISNANKEIERDALRAGKSAAEARRAALESEIKAESKRREADAKSEIQRAVIRSETEAKLRGVALDAEIADLRTAANERDRAANRGASASRKQTERAQKYIASLQDELDILRETDPVQKEMIRNRVALAGATEEERKKVEELIRTRQREEQQQKQVQDAWEFSKNSAYDALETLILQGGKASEVMANLANAIAKALLQSALLGTGPLAGIFGGQGTGLLDVIGGALRIPGVPAKADGGLMIGPGGPREDKILARLSNGEFVVNAAATARHRPLLEQINRAPAFANGGFVGGGAAAAAFGQGGRGPIEIMLMLSDDLNARIVKVSEGVSVRTVKAGLQHYDAKVLPVSLQKVQGDPRRVG